MKQIAIKDDATARRLYSSSSDEWKKVLEDNYGKEFFSTDTREYIKTVEDAYQANGETPKFNSDDTVDEVNYKKLKAIIKALNNDPSFPDFNNANQRKYYPWVKKENSGFGLSFSAYDDSDSLTTIGSRLVLKSPELCEYLVKQFPKEYGGYIF